MINHFQIYAGRMTEDRSLVTDCGLVHGGLDGHGVVYVCTIEWERIKLKLNHLRASAHTLPSLFLFSASPKVIVIVALLVVPMMMVVISSNSAGRVCEIPKIRDIFHGC